MVLEINVSDRTIKVSRIVYFVSLISCILLFFKYVWDCLLICSETLRNEPEKFRVFSELFNRYGCETKAEFESFLERNSYAEWGYKLVNGSIESYPIKKYNETASSASIIYDEEKMYFWDNVIIDPQQYLQMDLAIVSLLILIPIVFYIIYRVLKNKRLDMAFIFGAINGTINWALRNAYKLIAVVSIVFLVSVIPVASGLPGAEGLYTLSVNVLDRMLSIIPIFEPWVLNGILGGSNHYLYVYFVRPIVTAILCLIIAALYKRGNHLVRHMITGLAIINILIIAYIVLMNLDAFAGLGGLVNIAILIAPFVFWIVFMNLRITKDYFDNIKKSRNKVIRNEDIGTEVEIK